jgi:hypothetical protein
VLLPGTLANAPRTHQIGNKVQYVPKDPRFIQSGNRAAPTSQNCPGSIRTSLLAVRTDIYIELDQKNRSSHFRQLLIVRKTPLTPTRTTQGTGRACRVVRIFHHGAVALEPATRGPLSQSSPVPFGRNSARLKLSENPESFDAYCNTGSFRCTKDLSAANKQVLPRREEFISIAPVLTLRNREAAYLLLLLISFENHEFRYITCHAFEYNFVFADSGMLSGCDWRKLHPDTGTRG